MSNARDDLPSDSLFERMPAPTPMVGSAERDRCMGCGEYVMPNSEARTAHISGGCEAWEAHCRGESVPGWEDVADA